jgi:hypothetical protein
MDNSVTQFRSALNIPLAAAGTVARNYVFIIYEIPKQCYCNTTVISISAVKFFSDKTQWQAGMQR